MKKLIIIFVFLLSFMPYITKNGISFELTSKSCAQTLEDDSRPDFDGNGDYHSSTTGWDWTSSNVGDNSSDEGNNDEIDNPKDDDDTTIDNDLYGDNGDYQENELGNGYNNTNPSTLTEAQRVSVLATMVNQLNTLMKQKYGNNITLLPPVQYSINYPGRGFGMYLNGIIYIPPRFFDVLATDGDRLSTLYHEYTHYINYVTNKNPINKVNGIIPVVTTSSTCSQVYYNQAEHDYNYNSYLKDGGTASLAKAYADGEDKAIYEYKCSNYFKDEVAAREAEIQGEKDGLFVLSNDYRQKRLDGIKQYTWFMERALSFEKILPGYNNDGTPKTK
jgi:hypothetical protein